MSTPTQSNQYGRVRASDAEREEYAQVLRAGMSEGRLSLEVGEERLGQAYAATFRDELDPLIADLPRNAQYSTPEFLAEAGQRLRRHRNIVFSVAALLTGIWLLFAIVVHPVFFWPLIPIVIMLIRLRRHRRLYHWYARGGGWGPWARGWDGRGWDGSAQGWGGPGQGWAGHGWAGQGWAGPGRGWDRRRAWAHSHSHDWAPSNPTR